VAFWAYFYADVKGRMEKLGPSRDHLKILPGVLVVVGDTAAEAQAKRMLLDSLVHPDSGQWSRQSPIRVLLIMFMSSSTV
jgi:alkanesulfonate monooxygenase SsuD/methylene tetrahydromethanopterin reductase-like flavin-dependent oxidoreductase (luciferase family)